MSFRKRRVHMHVHTRCRPTVGGTVRMPFIQPTFIQTQPVHSIQACLRGMPSRRLHPPPSRMCLPRHTTLVSTHARQHMHGMLSGRSAPVLAGSSVRTLACAACLARFAPASIFPIWAVFPGGTRRLRTLPADHDVMRAMHCMSVPCMLLSIQKQEW